MQVRTLSSNFALIKRRLSWGGLTTQKALLLGTGVKQARVLNCVQDGNPQELKSQPYSCKELFSANILHEGGRGDCNPGQHLNFSSERLRAKGPDNLCLGSSLIKTEPIHECQFELFNMCLKLFGLIFSLCQTFRERLAPYALCQLMHTPLLPQSPTTDGLCPFFLQ